jgi:Ni/Co efflux regulator RcnB
MSVKLWFRVGALALVSLALSMTVAVAQGNGHGHDKHDRDDDRDRWQDREEGHGHGHGHQAREHGNGHGRGHYKDRDRDIHDWYRTHYSNLPPGLSKRDRLPPGLERQLVVNGTLPPGLRGKMQPCPRELEVMLPPPEPGYRHVVIGGNLVLVNRVSFQVADVFHFDAAF